MKARDLRRFAARSGPVWLLLALAGGLQASAPAQLTYQGRLKESGLPVTGTRSVDIQLCPAATGAAGCVDTGVQNGVSVVNGLFHVVFSVPSSVALVSGPWYLEVQVGGVAFTPREMLSASAYSIYASSATTLIAEPGANYVQISTAVSIQGHDASGYSLILSTGLSAPNGTISAKMFAGDGSRLTNLPPSPSVDPTKLPLAGGTMSGALNMNNVAVNLVGASGVLTGASSVTASAFFGDGSHLSNIVASGAVAKTGDTMSGQLTLSGSSLTVTGAGGIGARYGVTAATAVFSGAVTAGSFTGAHFGDGSGLSVPGSAVDLSTVTSAFNALAASTTTLSASTVTLYAVKASSGYNADLTALGVVVTIKSSPTVEGSLSVLGDGGLTVLSSMTLVRGLYGSSATFTSGLTASSGTFRASGPSQFSLTTASGVFVQNGGVYAPFVSATAYYGDGSHLSNVGAGSVANGVYTNVSNVLTSPNSPIVMTPSAPPGAGTKMLDLQTSGGVTNFSVNELGDATAHSVVSATHVGGSAAGSILTLQSTTGVGLTDAIKFAVGNNGATEAMRVITSGSVGVGTPAPAARLDVNGDAQFGSGAAKSTFTATGALTMASGAGLTLSGSGGTVASASSVTASAFFGDGSHLSGVTATSVGAGGVDFSTITAALAVHASSGTNADLSKLLGAGASVTVSTSLVVASSMTVLGKAVVKQLDVTSNIIESSVGTLLLNTLDGSDIYFDVGGLTQGIFKGSGRLGVGTTAPASALDVVGNAQFGAGASKSTFTVVGGLFLASGSSLTLSGAGGFVTSGSSIIAGAFFGDGSHLTGVIASSAVVTIDASMAGDGSPANPLGVDPSSVAILNASRFVVNEQIDASSITKQGNAFNGVGQLVRLSGGGGFSLPTGGSILLSGAAGVLAGASSVTASAFFGDGSHLSGVHAALVAPGGVDFSTITTAIGVRASSGTNADIGALLGAGNSVTFSTSVTVNSTMTVLGGGFMVANATGRQGILTADNALPGLRITASGAGNEALSLETAAGNPIYFKPNATTRMVLNGGGSLGLGVAAPVTLLDVGGDAAFGSGAIRSTFTNAGNLLVGAGVSAVSLTAASATLTGAGSTQYSLQTSSGIIVQAGGVSATFFSGAFFGSGSGLTGVSGTDASKVLKAGDAMTGPLTLAGSTLTVSGNAFSVGGTTFAVSGGNVGIGTSAPVFALDVNGGAQFGAGAAKSTFTAVGGLFLASGSSLTLSGANGFVTSGSSITAGAFFGDGSHLLNVVAASILPANIQAGAMGPNVIASSVAVSGVAAASYGSATQVPSYTVGVDGRLTAAANVPISLPASAVDLSTVTTRFSSVATSTTSIAASVAVRASSGTNADIAAFLGAGNSVTFSTSVIVNSSVTVYSSNMALVGNDPIFVINNPLFGGRYWNIGARNSVSGGFQITDQNAGQARLTIDTAGNVGIGKSAPATLLDVNGGVTASSLTLSGTLVASGVDASILPTGAGYRFMWVPSSGAVRGGYVNSNHWDPVNIGGASTAFGENSRASGAWAVVAGGYGNTANATYATVGGGQSNNVMSGTLYGTVSGGFTNVVSGSYGMVPGGDKNVAEGANSFAAGHRAVASAQGSFVWADSQNADLTNTTTDQFLVRAQGGFAVQSSSFIFANGISTFVVINSNGSMGVGTRNPAAKLHVSSGAILLDGTGGGLFFPDGSLQTTAAGSSQWVAAGSDIRNANLGAISMTGPATFGSSLTVTSGGLLFTGSVDGVTWPGGWPSGAGTRLMWIPSQSALRAGRVFGTAWDTGNIGLNSVAFGTDNMASGASSVIAGGNANSATNSYTAVGGGFGNQARGFKATIPGGDSNLASGDYSFAAGQRAKASAQGSFVWADSQASDLLGTTTDQFLVRARGGFLVQSSSFVFIGGNLGVGTSNPAAMLHVSSGALLIDGTNPSVSVGSGSFVVNAGGVGIGTPSPAYPLDVKVQSVAAIAESLARFQVSDDAASYLQVANYTTTDAEFVPVIRSNMGSTASSALVLESIVSNEAVGQDAIVLNSAGLGSTPLGFRNLLNVKNNGASKFIVDHAGNVGVGTASPLAGFDVAVGVNASAGNAYGARYQQTITSIANNDHLTAFLISPTFSDAFIGTIHNGLIVSTGAVGFGTMTPSFDLSLGAGNKRIGLEDSVSQSDLMIQAGNNTNAAAGNGGSVVLSAGHAGTTGNGGSIVLTAGQGSSATGSVVFSGSGSGAAHLKSIQSGVPTVGGVTCGGGTITPTVTLDPGSTDAAGTVSITVGSPNSAPCSVTINFIKSYSNSAAAPLKVIVGPNNANTPTAYAVPAVGPNSGNFIITTQGSPAASTSMKYSYFVIE